MSAFILPLEITKWIFIKELSLNNVKSPTEVRGKTEAFFLEHIALFLRPIRVSFESRTSLKLLISFNRNLFGHNTILSFEKCKYSLL